MSGIGKTILLDVSRPAPEFPGSKIAGDRSRRASVVETGRDYQVVEVDWAEILGIAEKVSDQVEYVEN